MAWLLYGKHINSDLLHISEASRGESCNCFCPFCNEPLAAKKGNVKVHHFAHLTKTCAFTSTYDFLHVESEVNYMLDIVEWSKWKLKNMEQFHNELKKEVEETKTLYDSHMVKVEAARKILDEESQINPRRKERSKARQANFEVLQQLDKFLTDHNASFPEFEKVRYTDSTATYNELYWERGYLQTTGNYYPSSLWQYPKQRFTPIYLGEIAQFLYYNYGKLRRKLVAAQEKLAAFEKEQARFKLFKLYFLSIEMEGQEIFFKIGITSRPLIVDRIKEIKNDLHKLTGKINIKCLYELPGYAFLETYFKYKYQPYLLKIYTHTEYFRFPDQIVESISLQLKKLWYSNTERRKKIKEGMQKAEATGTKLGRKSKEQEANFLKKSKSIEIATLIGDGMSLRQVEKQTGYSINTIRKVASLLQTEPVKKKTQEIDPALQQLLDEKGLSLQELKKMLNSQ